MTAIVAMGLGLRSAADVPMEGSFFDSLLTTSSGTATPGEGRGSQYSYGAVPPSERCRWAGRTSSSRTRAVCAAPAIGDYKPMFTNKTKALFFGVQPKAVQGREGLPQTRQRVWQASGFRGRV
jgi:ATP citrate (pro-S)-lyase